MKVALVSGSSRGIGRGIADLLHDNGYTVVYCGTRRERPADLPEDRPYHGLNIAESEQRKAIIDWVIATYGRLDVLVNNAGVAPLERRDILEMTEESFDYVVGTNLRGTMFMTQMVVKQMLTQPVKGRRRGVIVNISSSSVTVSSTNRGEYCMSKAGLAMMTTLYADRLAAEDIQVYEIRPGVIDTDMTKVVHQKYSNLIEQGAFPIARWGTPDDIAGAVSAFCTDKFIYSTGNYIDLDGGFHIKRL